MTAASRVANTPITSLQNNSSVLRIDGQVRATSLAVGVRALVERIAIQAGGKLFDGLSHQEPGSRGDITEAGPGDFTV